MSDEDVNRFTFESDPTLNVNRLYFETLKFRQLIELGEECK